MVQEERVRQIPVTTCRFVQEERVEQFNVRVCRMVEEQQTIRVPRTICNKVPVTYTMRVPRTIMLKVPCCGGAMDACETTSVPVVESATTDASVQVDNKLELIAAL